jgi:hypothetical protein
MRISLPGNDLRHENCIGSGASMKLPSLLIHPLQGIGQKFREKVELVISQDCEKEKLHAKKLSANIFVFMHKGNPQGFAHYLNHSYKQSGYYTEFNGPDVRCVPSSYHLESHPASGS